MMPSPHTLKGTLMLHETCPVELLMPEEVKFQLFRETEMFTGMEAISSNSIQSLKVTSTDSVLVGSICLVIIETSRLRGNTLIGRYSAAS